MSDLIAYVKARIVEDGDCWIWQRHMDRNDIPMCRFGGPVRSVRRTLWDHVNPDKPLRKLVATTSCGVRGCVNPAHIVAKPLRKAQQAAAKRGAYNKPEAVAARTLAMQRISPLAPHVERVREMLAQGYSSIEIAASIGCSSSAVRRLNRGDSHRPVLAGASVFAWRGNINL